ncbi:MAG: AarF/ABC1/UbiB kinase family protein [Alphaproteobacteria bacterium]|nr:AarF/ABC1/UbiB kinase family protein [Alphaproteobacteria bacterium]
MTDDKDDERSTFGGRLRRYARTTAGVGSVAARTGARFLFGRALTDIANAADAARILGQLRGPVMKIAQVAGSLPDVFPPEFAAELAKLQTSAPPMGPAFVRRRMAAELGPDWQSKFKSFDMTPAAAASLGQVHRATTKDGRAVACKLQYPDMQSAVDADIAQVQTILSLQRAAVRTLDTSEIAAEAADRVREELDYEREAANMRLFGEMLRATANVSVPEPIEALSTHRLLTMTWLDGAPFLPSVAGAPQERRDAIGRALHAAWWGPLCRYAVIHGDAHLGNYTVRADDGINLLDFGCTRVYEPAAVGGFVDLYRALKSKDDAATIQAYERWGFRGADQALVEKLREWAKIVFEPVLDDRERFLIESDSPFDASPERIWALKRQLQFGSTVRPPRSFVFISRALVGLGAALVHLKARLNWHRMFEALIADFSIEAVAQRQSAALALARVPDPLRS